MEDGETGWTLRIKGRQGLQGGGGGNDDRGDWGYREDR